MIEVELEKIPGIPYTPPPGTHSDAEIEPPLEYIPPTPETATASKDLSGTPVEIDGETWIFADYPVPPFSVLDEFFDQNIIARQYEKFTVQRIAVELLQANYELLSDDEAVEIILKAKPQSLVEAVEAIIFGRTKPRKTYTDWLFSAFAANGVDPKAVHPSRWLDVANHLVECGRAIPRDQFVTAAVVVSSRERLLKNLQTDRIRPSS